MITRSELRIGASNWSGATRAKSAKKRGIIPSRENLGRCRNTTSSIIPKGNKKSRTSGWNLGRDGNRSIQRMIPKRK
jgi:hypothetical protein